ncbi:methyl-accepting chemotaxis protein [Vogesella fluminis]|uniref:Chemotaxis transducer n=1 Tax=Vogesella fluminis TaxID=1069161 RepID=A0ABQ3H8F2_9NEIS|nr:methyl-accepting chemotaxis protein [Vogesella fluminis]GHD71195.1 chemotaxis transducer [Vogesella fluminis]
MNTLSRLSIRTRILLAVALSVLVGFSLTLFIIIQQQASAAREQGLQSAAHLARAEAENVARTFRSAFDSVHGVGSAFVGLKHSGVTERKAYDAIMATELERNRTLLALSSAWEPNALDGRDAEFVDQPAHDKTGRYIPYWNRGSDKVAVEPLVDYEKTDADNYYFAPKQSGRDYLMEPYVYPVGGKPVLMTSAMAPLKVDGRFVGVVGADFALADLQAALAPLHPMADGYVTLLSNAGHYVAHPDPARAGKPASELPAAALAAIKAGQPYHFVDAADNAYFLAPVVASGEAAPWSLAVTIPMASILRDVDATRKLSMLIAAIAIAAILAGLALLLSWLTRPLLTLREAMGQLAGGGGDLSRRLPVARHDELGEASSAFNRFMDILRPMVAQVKQEATELRHGTHGLAQITDTIADGSAAQAKAASATAGSVNHLTANVSQIADSARDAEVLMQEASNNADKAAGTVGNTVSEIHGIASAVRLLGSTLDVLGRRSDDINGIVRVIHDIADQTNLLALNAAIEAARAGEMGRGFAVVADEVRKLAERTGNSTVEIGQMITSMHQETRKALDGMGDAIARVESGVALAQSAASEIEQINGGLSSVMTRMHSISSATQQQSAAMQNIASHVEQISQMAQQTDHAVSECRHAVRSLEARSDQLDTLTQGFRT